MINRMVSISQVRCYYNSFFYKLVFSDNLEIDSYFNGRIHLHAKQNRAQRSELVRCNLLGRSLVLGWHWE